MREHVFRDKDGITLAESALLLTAIIRESTKPLNNRDVKFRMKCQNLLKSIDEANQGPEKLKQLIKQKAKEKVEVTPVVNRIRKTRKPKIVRPIIIAAALVILLATVTLAIQVFNPLFSITMTEKFEEALENPSKRISGEQALSIAYDRAAELYGDFIYDFDIKSISEDDYHWDFILAPEFIAKDFKLYGPSCAVTVMIDGEINLCTYEGVTDYTNVQNLIADISMADLENFVREQANLRYGNEINEYEITEIQYTIENNHPILRIGVKHILGNPSYLTPEEMVRWDTFGIKEKIFDYYDFPLVEQETSVTVN